MNSPRLELPDFEKFAVSFDELLQKGVAVRIQKGDPKRSNPHLILDPAAFRQRFPWTDIPSPSSAQESSKDLEAAVPRPPLYKDRRRLVVFIGLMLAWLFVCRPLLLSGCMRLAG